MSSVIIRLQNLPISANASNIRRFFVGLNIPEGGVHIVGGEAGDAFIAFATDEDARKAMLLDRQTINSCSVRLFLSSKTEMQSVIETARSSVLTTQIINSSPKIPQTVNTTDVVNRNNSSESNLLKSENSALYGYATQQVPSEYQLPSNQNIVSTNKTREYEQPSIPMQNYDNQNSSWNQMRMQPPTSKLLVPNYQMNQHSFAEYTDKYHDSSDNYRQFSRPVTNINNLPVSNDKFLNKHYQQSESMIANAPQSLHENTHGSSNSYRSSQFYDGAYSNRSDKSIPVDTFSKKSNIEERDFSVRPPWLETENQQILKRPTQPVEQEKQEEVQSKRNRIHIESNDTSLETPFVLKLSISPIEVSIKAVFEILKGVNIVPKWGIRLEEDNLHRYTGYAYVMTVSKEAYDRALSFDNSNYKNNLITISPATANEFFSVKDSNFQSKCPPDIVPKLSLQSSHKPAYYEDGCLEISDLPSDVSASEVVFYLGAPGLTTKNVIIVPSDVQYLPGARSVVRLPSAKDLDILLSAVPRPFRGNLSKPARLTVISKMQFALYNANNTPVDTYESSNVPTSLENPSNSSTKFDEPPKPCIYLSGFSRVMNAFNVSKWFPSVTIPIEAINFIEDNNFLIDLLNESNTKKVFQDFSAAEKIIKKTHPNISIKGITRAEYTQKLYTCTKNTELDRNGSQSGHHLAPPIDNDSREYGQPQRDFSRFPSHQFMPNEYMRHKTPLPRPPFLNDSNINITQDNCIRHPEPYGHNQSQMLNPTRIPFPIRPDNIRGVTIYVNNLAPSASPEILMDVFRPYHPIPGSLRYRRAPNGQPMGEAMLILPSSIEAERAIHELNGFRLHGRNIVIHNRDYRTE